MRSWIAVLSSVLAVVCCVSTSTSASDPRFTQTLPPPSFFVALPAIGEVAILDPATNEIRQEAKFPGLFSYLPMVAAQTRPFVFVLANNGLTINEVNTITLKVVASAKVSASVTGMTVSQTDDALFAASGNDVLVLPVPIFGVAHTIGLPDQVYDVAVVGDGHTLIATLPNTHRFAIIDLTTHTIKGYIPTGPCVHDGIRDHCFPRDIVTSPGGRYAIGVSGRNALVVDTLMHKVVAAPEVKGHIFHDYALAVDPSTNELWIEGAAVEENWLTSMSQLPPFNILTSALFSNYDCPYRAAFTPTGQGYGSFFGNGLDKITTFPPSSNEVILRVGTNTGSIVYVP